MDRVILHCDMNNFYASVELLSHPELRDRPVAVGGDPNTRHGIIVAKNNIAKAYGVVTAETVYSALKKCPDLVFLKAHHDKYRKYSKMINEIYYRYTDMIEPFSIDESWLDVTASQTLFGSGKEIGDQIRETVKKELGLTLSCGVSYNKIFAKMGSEYKKPDATTVITRDNYRDIIWPQPVGEMFFIGKATAAKLNSFGIKTIGDLAVTDREWLEGVFGKYGLQMHEYTNGLDESPVSHVGFRSQVKSVGNGHTFKRNLVTEDDIRIAIMSLSDTVSSRLRKYQLKCCGVKVDIKNPDLKVISRQAQLLSPTNNTDEIFRSAMDTIKKTWKIGDPIRLLTVTGINIVDEDSDMQLSLFDIADGTAEQKENSIQIDQTIDKIREKFGKKSIQFGSIINNDIGISFVDVNEEDE